MYTVVNAPMEDPRDTNKRNESPPADRGTMAKRIIGMVITRKNSDCVRFRPSLSTRNTLKMRPGISAIVATKISPKKSLKIGGCNRALMRRLPR